MKSVQDDRLLSANDVINLIFKMAPRLIKRVYSLYTYFPARSDEVYSELSRSVSVSFSHGILATYKITFIEENLTITVYQDRKHQRDEINKP